MRSAPCPSAEQVRRYWTALPYLTLPSVRAAVVAELDGHEGVDAEALRALLAVLDGQVANADAWVSLAPRLTGTVDGAPSPWSVFLQHGLKHLPEATRSEVVQAIKPRLRAELVHHAQGHSADMGPLRNERMLAVTNGSVPAVAFAAAETFAVLGTRAAHTARIDEETRREQVLNDEYTELLAVFCAPQPTGRNLHTRARHLLEVEGALNSLRMSRTAPHRGMRARDGRFLSKGSSSVLRWWRARGCYDDAIEHACTQLSNHRLSRLRQATHAVPFETFLHHGIGAALDSGRAAHIERALAVFLPLEPELQPFRHPFALYTVACLLSRGGQIGRALDYAQRAVHAGEPVREMAKDAHFANILHHPRFQHLLQAA